MLIYEDDIADKIFIVLDGTLSKLKREIGRKRKRLNLPSYRILKERKEYQQMNKRKHKRQHFDIFKSTINHKMRQHRSNVMNLDVAKTISKGEIFGNAGIKNNFPRSITVCV